MKKRFVQSFKIHPQTGSLRKFLKKKTPVCQSKDHFPIFGHGERHE